MPGSLAVLPRKRLDEIVCRAAVAAGARMFAPLRFVAPLREGGRVVGAELEHDGATRQVRAAWLVLATGAQPQATLAAGLCERRAPSGIALRGYVRNPAMTPRITSLEVVWHKRLAPGLRLDLSLRRRPVQHRRRRRPTTAPAAPGPAGPRRTSTCARPSPRSSRSMRRRASWSKAANGRARPARR